MTNLSAKVSFVNDFHKSELMLTVLTSVFFVFFSLSTNHSILEAAASVEEALPIWLSAFSVILVLFFFLPYHYLVLYAFERKTAEYGILESLGVSQKNLFLSFIGRLGTFTFAVCIKGLLLGTLLLFPGFFLLNNVLGISMTYFSITPYAVIILVLLLAYFTHGIHLLRKSGSFSILSLLYYQKQVKDISHPLWYQNTGILLFFAGILKLIKKNSSYSFIDALLPMLCFACSAYFLTMSFSYWFIKLFAHHKKKYLQNLFYISQLKTNYKKYAKLLTCCTILILFGLHLFILDMNFTLSDQDRSFELPYDFAVSLGNMDKESYAEIRRFETSQANHLTETLLIPSVEGKIRWSSNDYDYPLYVMPVSSYQKLTGNALSLSTGQIIVLTQLDRFQYNLGIQMTDGIEWGFLPPSDISYQIANQTFQGNVVLELWQVVFNLKNQNQRTFLLPDDDYEALIQSTGISSHQYLLKTDGKADTAIYEQLKEFSPLLLAKHSAVADQRKNSLIVSVLLLLIVILLLTSLFCLIFMRLGQNLHEESQKYKSLLLIGYQQPQIEGEIKKEMRTLFLLPYFIGTCLTFLYTIFSTQDITPQLTLITFCASLLFLSVELIFFRFAVNRLSRNVNI